MNEERSEQKRLAMGARANTDAKSWLAWIIGIVAFLFIVFYPFQILTAPDWVVRVVDEDGHPIPQVSVTEDWQEYSVEEVFHEESGSTGIDGVVHFRPKTLRASLASRVVGCVQSIKKLGAHASCGAHAHVDAFKCNYGSLLADAQRTKGSSWMGWSHHKQAFIPLRHCPHGSSGIGCFSDAEMKRDCPLEPNK